MEETQYQVLVRDWDGAYVGVIDTWRSLSYLKLASDMGNMELRLGASSPYIDYFELDYVMEVWRRPAGRAWYCDYRAFWRGEKRIVGGLGDETYLALGLDLNHLLARRIAIGRRRYGVYPPKGLSTIEGLPDRILWELFKQNFSADAITIWAPGDWDWGSGWEGSREMPRISMEEPGGTGDEISVHYRWRNAFEIAQDVAGKGGGDFQVEMEGDDFVLRWYPGGKGLDRTVGNADGNEPCLFSMYLGNMREPIYENDRTSEATACYVTSKAASNKLRVGYWPKFPLTPGYDYRLEDSPWNRIEAHRDGSGIPGWMHNTTARKTVRELRPIEAFTFFPIESEGCRYGVHFDLGDHVTTYWGPTFTTRRDKQIAAVKIYVDHNGEEVVVEAGDVT